MTAQLTTAGEALQFILGGNAKFTLVSRKTGDHISLHVKRSKDGGCYFVSGRKNGDFNSGGFNYAGWMKAGETTVRPSKKANASLEGARAALSWALGNLAGGHLPKTLEVHHTGRCGCCGRPLTDPVSVARGIGPECIKKATHSKVIA